MVLIRNFYSILISKKKIIKVEKIIAKDFIKLDMIYIKL